MPAKLKEQSLLIGADAGRNVTFAKPEYWGFVKRNAKQRKYVPHGLGHMYFVCLKSTIH